MATNGVNLAGVIIPPSLPTIKESTLSWLGSELDSSIFSANGYHGDNDPAVQQLTSKNIQRCIDFDEQCLSLKSGEESEFSGVQPLPVGSDDTPPTAGNEFNRAVQIDFGNMVNRSQNRPKPMITCDDEADVQPVDEKTEPQKHIDPLKTVSSSGLQELMGMLGSEVSNLVEPGGSGDNAAVGKLQLIRLWQLMQQEDLRRRQEAEIAVLNAQRVRMKLDRDQRGSQICGLEPVDPELETQDLDEMESGDLCSDIAAEEEECNENNECNSAGADDKLNSKNIDEIPVENEKKSFEQLLEEELKKEERNKNKPVSTELKPKCPIKRPFLRKGEGLARFKGPPVRKNKPLNKDQVKKTSKTRAQPPKPRIEKSDDIAHQRIVNKPPSGIETSLQQTKPVQKLLQKVSVHKIVPVAKKQDTYIRKIEPTEVVSSPHLGNATGFFKPAGDADLEEFEMLERYAEDDASFFNEPSLVASVLQQETPKDDKQMSLRDRVRERRRLREEARVKIQNAVQEFAVGDSQIGKTTVGESYQDEDMQEDDELLSPVTPKPYFKSPEKTQTKVIQRKTASLVKKEKLIHPISHSPAFSPTLNPTNVLLSNHTNPDIYTSPHSAFSPHHQVNPKPTESNVPCDNLQPDDFVFVDDDFQDDQSWGDVDVSMNVLSQRPQVECKNKEESGKTYKCSDYMVPENEDAENPVRDTNPTPLSSARGLSLSPAPPPTTLMQKLFPSLKVPKPTLIASQQSSVEASDAPEIVDAGCTKQDVLRSESQASLLKQKLEELENEISRFKKENSELESVRKKQEQDARNLAKEVEEFRKQKDDELARLEEYKKVETKKLKKEKKLFEEHVIATKMLPKKEEREEITRLQEELENLRAENSAKEQKWNSTCSRLRSQISSLKTENEELQERIEELETQRIKERKLLKSKTPKQPSVWETVNDIVDSTVVEMKKDFPKGHDHHSGGKKKTKVEPKKSGSLSSAVAMSNLKDTLERTKPREPEVKEMLHPDGKVEKILPDGRRIIDFPNGTQKEVSSDGKMVKVLFANGDVKEIYDDGSIVYYYDENGTTHTTHPDGLQVFEFPNKQVEHHFCDGTKQITFPDQTVKYLHTDGTEQTVFPDGTEMHVAINKDKTIVFANGQREIHTNSFKRREYPDGTSKTVFEDGRQETRYASGRLRVKDVHGNVIVDRMIT